MSINRGMDKEDAMCVCVCVCMCVCVCVCVMKYYSAIAKELNWVICRDVGRPRAYHRD